MLISLLLVVLLKIMINCSFEWIAAGIRDLRLKNLDLEEHLKLQENLRLDELNL